MLSTQYIQHAIDLCSETGGSVLIPKGKYACGTLFLKDNVNLHVEAGAEIVGSHDIKYYSDTIPVMIEDPKFSTCLIYTRNVKNIPVTGMGIINERWYTKYFNHEKGDKRPMLMRLEKCTNVLIRYVILPIQHHGALYLSMLTVFELMG